MSKIIGMTVLAALVGCGGGGDGIDGAVWTSKGSLVNESGAGIADAVVSVTLDRTYSATTDASGNYELKLPQAYAFPTHFSGLASKTGILPKPVFFSYQNGKLSFTSKTTTRALTESDIIFQSSMNVVHLGDSNYGGAANSQFQFPNATGIVWSESATLSAGQKAKYSQLCINFYAKGIDERPSGSRNTISISKNGQQGTYIVRELSATNSDGSYSVLNECFSLATFQAQDLVRVQLNSMPRSGDYDDFEFIAVTGILK